MKPWVISSQASNTSRDNCIVSKPLLETHSLCRTNATGDKVLLDNISLRVRTGDRIALTGSSGAGKSLLLRSLAMLDPVQQGAVLWRGKPVSDAEVPEFRSQVMYLGQRNSLLEGTVEHNLRAPYGLKIHAGKAYNADRIIGWLSQLGRSADFLKKGHAQLSGGETQIMSLLRALQLDPIALLADEPTSAMDTQTAVAAEQLVLSWLDAPSRDAKQERRALVWVSHDAAQAERLATRNFRMQDGRILTDDSSTATAS